MNDAPGIDNKEMKRLLEARLTELEGLIRNGIGSRIDTELDQQRIGRLSRLENSPATMMCIDCASKVGGQT